MAHPGEAPPRATPPPFGVKSRVAALAAQVKPVALTDADARLRSGMTPPAPAAAFGEPVWVEPESEVLDLDLDEEVVDHAGVRRTAAEPLGSHTSAPVGLNRMLGRTFGAQAHQGPSPRAGNPQPPVASAAPPDAQPSGSSPNETPLVSDTPRIRAPVPASHLCPPAPAAPPRAAFPPPRKTPNR